MAVLNVSFKMRDSEGHFTTVLIQYNESEINTVALAQEVATVIAPKLNGLSGSTVIGARADFPLTVPVDPVGVDAGSRNDAGATLSFHNVSGTAHSLYIPGFLTSKLENGVVTVDADVAGFIATLVAGDGITDNRKAVDRHELYLDSYRKGFQSTRKTR